jgi:hypothetical protein
VTQPKNVKFAVFIYFAVIILSFIGGITNYIAVEPRPSLFSTLLVWFVFYGLFIALGCAIQTGKNWARHLNAVITLVSLASVFMAGVSQMLVTGFSNVVLLINNFASVAVLVLLYTRSANEWFTSENA